MFAVPYPTIPQLQEYTTQAHRLRAALLSTLIRDIARWVASAAR